MASTFLPAVFISASSLHLECELKYFFPAPCHPHTLFPTHCEVMHPGDNHFTLLYHLYLQDHASSGPLSEHLPSEVQLLASKLGSSLYQGVFRGCMAEAFTNHMAP